MCSSVFLEYTTMEEIYILQRVNVCVIMWYLLELWAFYVYGVVLFKLPPNHVFYALFFANVRPNVLYLVNCLVCCSYVSRWV